MPNKTKSPTKTSSQELFEKHKHLKWLLPLFIIVVIFSFMFQKNVNTNSINTQTLKVNSMANWKTYTRNVSADKTSYYNDPKFTITIQYPSGWVIKESHTLSNRVVDNPKEINTAILSGKEGEIVMEWGPMGFGGGCDPSMHKTLQLKDIKVDTCQSKDSNGNQSWSGIDSPNVNQPFDARASASLSDPSGNVIRKIFSTLQFTN